MSNPNIDLCLSFHLTYSKLRLQLDEELGLYHGIDFDDFALLHWLARAGGEQTALGILASELGTSRSVLLRRLRPLEKIGLVACHGGVPDRRVALRPPSLRVLKTAHDTVASVCARLSLIEKVNSLNQAALV
jgi:DNA-binding MarR family transcriptional regulator